MARGGRNEVGVTFTGDASDLDRTLKDVDEGTERFSDRVKSAGADVDRFRDRTRDAGEGLDRFGERADEAERRATGFRDGVTGAQDSMASLSSFARGDFQGGLLLAGSGVADLSSSMANGLVPTVKDAVARLGAMRLAMLGAVGAGAALGVGLVLWARSANQFSADVSHAQEDLQRFIDTGRRTVLIRDVFGESRMSVEQWAETVEDAHQTWGNFLERAGDEGSWDVLIGKADAARARLHAADEALAEYVDTTGDFRAAEQLLREEMGDVNYEAAVADGQFTLLQSSIARATERADEHSGAIDNIATAYGDALTRLKEWQSEILHAGDPVFRLVTAQQGVTAAEEAYADALRESGAGSREAEAAQFDLIQARIELSDAQHAADMLSEADIRRVGQAAGLSADDVQVLIDKLHEADGTTVDASIRLRYTEINRPVAIPGTARGGFMEFTDGIPRFHDGIRRVPDVPGGEMLAILESGEEVVSAGEVARGGRGDVHIHGDINVNGSQFRDGSDFEAWLRGLRNASRQGVAKT